MTAPQTDTEDDWSDFWDDDQEVHEPTVTTCPGCPCPVTGPGACFCD